MASTQSADAVMPSASAGRAIAGLPADNIRLDWLMGAHLLRHRLRIVH